MCSGPRKPSPPCGHSAGVDVDEDKLSITATEVPLLLELSACDDLLAFKRAVEVDGLPVSAAAQWYGRSLSPSPRRMAFELRTALMIAASYGSLSVLNYILSLKLADVNQQSGSDGATALHCAAGGGSSAAVDAVKLLINASADVDAVDACGNRPADLIPRQVSGSITKSLEVILRSANCSRSPSPSSPVAGDSPTKKEYPPDLTLPDITSGIYGTDEFRMYAFKIKPCSRAYSHDWTECPFVHPGENARRRDPRKYLYSCVPCPEFRKGTCRNGDACEYAHGVFESWLHPAQYRTRLCKDEVGCNRRVCFFAHKPGELRAVNPSTASTALGGSLPSPRSPSVNGGVSAMDMAAALLMMQQPSSPSASSAQSSWIGQTNGVMASSRLKSSLSARDMALGLELLGLEGYQQKLINEMAGAAASPRSSWPPPPANKPLVSDYSDLLSSLDSTTLSQLQGLSMKQKPAAVGAQFPSSPTAGIQKHQFLPGYGTSMSPSSPVSVSSSIGGLDQSLAKAIMNSRASSFAKRSQSFVDRRAMPHHPSLSISPPPSMPAASGLSNWDSPTGKLDWGIEGDELSKLRKSVSFNNRSNPINVALQNTAAAAAADEPDLSWVHSLVKDAPPAYMEQLYMEQEQIA